MDGQHSCRISRAKTQGRDAMKQSVRNPALPDPELKDGVGSPSHLEPHAGTVTGRALRVTLGIIE